MGLDQWVGGLEFINYFDIFDGLHPRIFVPALIEAQEFKSMEDVANYLVAHPQFRAKVKSQAKGKAIFVMFDEETERLCQVIDLDIALPPAALRTRLDSKIETTRIGKTRIGNMAGVASVPNVLGKANSYSELRRSQSAQSLVPNWLCRRLRR
jgi:biotin carboxylase